MNETLELWQILGNQAFDDAFYSDMLKRLYFAQNDTNTLVSSANDTDTSKTP